MQAGIDSLYPAPNVLIAKAFLITSLALTVCGLEAGQRSAAEVAAFKRSNPCPANGLRRGGCPGHQVDHIRPLCAGGEDKPSNMQWITTGDHRFKTFVDVRECMKRQRGEREAFDGF